MAAHSTKLGPGTLKLGPTLTATDASCQLTGAVVSWGKDTDDPIRVLCGDTVPGGVRYNATIAGNFLQDLAEDAGLVAYTWENKGTDVAFEFVPNTEAGATVTGTLVVDPLDVGGTDAYGATLSADFEWTIVGEPVLAWGP